jgi:uncharacterized protein (DUF433 family)
MHERIAVRPQIHFGKPCVAGTRITVQSVLELIREGVPSAEIRCGYYPELGPEDIRATLPAIPSSTRHQDGNLKTN